MAELTFDTYSALKTSVAAWLHRADLTDAIPSFIKLCEAAMQRDLKTGEQETTSTLSVASGGSTIALPVAFQKLRRLRVFDGGVYLDLFPVELAPSNADGVTATPIRLVSIQGNNLVLHNPTDQAYTLSLDYFAKFTPLSDSAETNWILTDHPDAYLYGTLLQSAPFLGTDNRIALWEGAFSEVIAKINRQDFEKRSSTLQTTSDVYWAGRSYAGEMGWMR